MAAKEAQESRTRRTEREPTMAVSAGFGTACAPIRRMTRRAYIVSSPFRSENRALSSTRRSVDPHVDSRGPWTAVYDRIVGTRMLRPLIVVVSVSAAGCGGSSSSPPADVSGTYGGMFTNGTSTCPGPWNMGAMNPIQFKVTQSGANVVLQVPVTSAATLILAGAAGNLSFNGTVSGSHIEALLIGSAQNTYMDCMYQLDWNLSADVANNTLTGIVVQTPKNGSATCAALGVNGCSWMYSFSLPKQ